MGTKATFIPFFILPSLFCNWVGDLVSILLRFFLSTHCIIPIHRESCDSYRNPGLQQHKWTRQDQTLLICVSSTISVSKRIFLFRSEYFSKSSNTFPYHWIVFNIIEYFSISSNTFQYHRTLFNIIEYFSISSNTLNICMTLFR